MDAPHKRIIAEFIKRMNNANKKLSVEAHPVIKEIDGAKRLYQIARED